MADDAYKRIQPGQTFRPAAKVWNAMLDVVEDYRARTGFGQAGIDVGTDGRIWIQNDTDDTLPQFSIVGIGEAITSPQDDEAEFVRTMCFGSISPLATARFAIIQNGIESGTVGEARVVGLSHCYVDRTDTAHNFANPEDDNYDNLVSATTGTAEILWIDDLPVAAIGETVHEGSGAPSGGTGSDGDYYKDTVGEQYYGPKTAGSWGSAHDYGTGICWAVVVLDQADTDDGPTVRVGLGRSGTGPNLGATAAAWSSTVEYQVGDVVSLSGSNYYCILAHTNFTPPNATYWDVTTEDLIVVNVPDASDANRGIVNRYNQKFGNDDGAYIGKWFACPVYGQQFIIPKANPFYSPTTGLNTINAVDIVGTVPYSSYGDDGFTIYNYITNPSSVVVSYEYVTFSCAIDVFSGSNTYSLGDKVQYLGRLYTYINATPSGVSPAFPTYWAEWNYPVSPATTMKGFYSHGFVAAEHGYLARESGSGNWRLGTSGTIFGLNWGDGILLGGTPAVPGTSITAGTLPTSVLAPSFYLPAANAGTVMEAENKSGSTISPGMVVTTHSSGTGFVLADATDVGKSVTGIARESIANTVSGEIQSEGLITLADWTAATGSATLAAKANYFSDPANPGKLTTTAPTTTGHVSQLVGVAVSDDTMDLILSPPILL